MAEPAASVPSVNALHAFLTGLRGRGFAMDAGRMAACQRLLLDTHAAGPDSRAARRLKFRLAPVVVRTAAEQAEFYRLYDAGLGPVIPEKATPPAPSETPTPSSPRARRSRRSRMVALLLATVIAVLAVAVVHHLWPEPPPPPPINPTAGQTQAKTTAQAYDLPRDRFQITETVISPLYRSVTMLLAVLPPAAFVAWLVVRWRRRSLWLARDRARLGHDPATTLPLPLRPADVLYSGPEMRDGARHLRHYGFRPSRRLDASRTVEATARRAGLITPVYQHDMLLPEYVFLIEQNGANDHLARLFDLAVDRLRHEHVSIERYYFRADPRHLQADDSERKAVTLAELATRTADDHRLFVLGTADGFFHPLTGEVESWVSRLNSWPSRTVLSTRPIGHWDTAELRLLDEGFSLATAEASGFVAAGGKMMAGDHGPELLEGSLVMARSLVVGAVNMVNNYGNAGDIPAARSLLDAMTAMADTHADEPPLRELWDRIAKLRELLNA